MFKGFRVPCYGGQAPASQLLAMAGHMPLFGCTSGSALTDQSKNINKNRRDDEGRMRTQNFFASQRTSKPDAPPPAPDKRVPIGPTDV